MLEKASDWLYTLLRPKLVVQIIAQYLVPSCQFQPQILSSISCQFLSSSGLDGEVASKLMFMEYYLPTHHTDAPLRSFVCFFT